VGVLANPGPRIRTRGTQIVRLQKQISCGNDRKKSKSKDGWAYSCELRRLAKREAVSWETAFVDF